MYIKLLGFYKNHINQLSDHRIKLGVKHEKHSLANIIIIKSNHVFFGESVFLTTALHQVKGHL